MTLLALLKSTFWTPVADLTVEEVLLLLAPALVFDFFADFVFRVGVVSIDRLRQRLYALSLPRRQAELKRRHDILEEDISATRRNLSEWLAAGDYRQSEEALYRLHRDKERLDDVRRRLEKSTHFIPYAPKVSILVPCHNSEDVIIPTLDCLTGLTYPKAEIIVIDDGSTDSTAEKVDQFITSRVVDGGGIPVRLVRRRHTAGLKTGAVNFGLAFAAGDVIAVVDDDTRLAPDAINWVVEPLADPEVAACGGNIRATADRPNLLVRLQEIEYSEAMNLGRPWQSLVFGAVFVISGAFGVFKRADLRRVGEYDVETVAEDLDVTWKLYRLRRRVLFAPKAKATTEVPTSIKRFVRQRRRWDYGLLQTLSKQRSLVFRRRYGSVGMLLLPTVILFEFLLALIRPVYVMVLVLFGYDLWRVVLTTFYFYLILIPMSMVAAGLLAGDGWRAFRVHYAPLVLVYRLFLSGIRFATVVRYTLGRPPVW